MAEGRSTGETVTLTEEEARKRRGRSIVMGIVLGALVVVFWAVAYFKLGPAILDRAL